MSQNRVFNNKVTVFANHSEVCHAYALYLTGERTNDKGKGARIFYEGNTIYSYGYHFPVACKVGDKVFYTKREYSISTSKHKGYIWSAIRHLNLIDCYYVEETTDLQGQLNNVQAFLRGMDNDFSKLAKARKPEIYLTRIARERAQLITFMSAVGLTLTKAKKELRKIAKDWKGYSQGKEAKENLQRLDFLFASDFSGMEAQLQQAAKEAKRKQQALNVERLDKFRKFELHTLQPRLDYDYLRFNEQAGMVETSQGVKIQAKEAASFYTWLVRTAANGGCANCGMDIEGFKVIKVTPSLVEIGCHTITIKECKAIIPTIEAYLKRQDIQAI